MRPLPRGHSSLSRQRSPLCPTWPLQGAHPCCRAAMKASLEQPVATVPEKIGAGLLLWCRLLPRATVTSPAACMCEARWPQRGASVLDIAAPATALSLLHSLSRPT